MKLSTKLIIQKINSPIVLRDLKDPKKLLLSLNNKMPKIGIHRLLFSPFKLFDQLNPILTLLFNSSLRKIRIKRRRGLRLLNLQVHYLLQLRWTLKRNKHQKLSKETWWLLLLLWTSSCKPSSRVTKRRMTLVMTSRAIQLIILILRTPLKKLQIYLRGRLKMKRSTFAPITIMLTMLPPNPFMSRKVHSNHQLRRSRKITRYKLTIQIMKLHNSNNFRTSTHTHLITTDLLRKSHSPQRGMRSFNTRIVLQWSSSIHQ